MQWSSFPLQIDFSQFQTWTWGASQERSLTNLISLYMHPLPFNTNTRHIITINSCNVMHYTFLFLGKVEVCLKGAFFSRTPLGQVPQSNFLLLLQMVIIAIPPPSDSTHYIRCLQIGHLNQYEWHVTLVGLRLLCMQPLIWVLVITVNSTSRPLSYLNCSKLNYWQLSWV